MLAIFSSGSVQAQLQFFSYVDDGSGTRDLKPLFAAHFDTVSAGSKLEKASYEKICKELAQEAGTVSFLTDNVLGTSDIYPMPHLISSSPLPRFVPCTRSPALTSAWTLHLFLRETAPNGD